ncbi:hypothetical protein Scep_027611 [Stephania cephalantha]|uniref:Uncharacterized protein n=1 Tax=Stephania cephalantha TaxID=152367 RepID=A0AAP0HIN7_9MAGN
MWQRVIGGERLGDIPVNESSTCGSKEAMKKARMNSAKIWETATSDCWGNRSLDPEEIDELLNEERIGWDIV